MFALFAMLVRALFRVNRRSQAHAPPPTPRVVTVELPPEREVPDLLRQLDRSGVTLDEVATRLGGDVTVDDLIQWVQGNLDGEDIAYDAERHYQILIKMKGTDRKAS